MVAYNTLKDDAYARPIYPVLCNTAKDGSGTWYFALVDSDSHLQVDALSMLETRTEVRKAKAIEGTGHEAEDVLNDTNCTTTAVAWEFTGMASANGGYGVIDFATIFNETENVEPRIKVVLFNAEPTGVKADLATNTNPEPEDRLLYVGTIEFPALDKVSTDIASVSYASPSTVGNLPLFYKCASGSTSLFAIIVALDAFTHTATDDIEVVFQIRHLS